MATAIAEPKTEFRVVKGATLLIPRNPKDGLSRDVRGQVAFMPSKNAYVARWQSPHGFSYAEWNPKSESLAKPGWRLDAPNWPDLFRAREEEGMHRMIDER